MGIHQDAARPRSVARGKEGRQEGRKEGVINTSRRHSLADEEGRMKKMGGTG